MVHVQVNGETITCTTKHPFYVQGKGWVAAKDLKLNDKLELQNGEDAFVDAIRREQLDQPIQVFNFEVEDFHTYYVGAGCVLVHNTCKKEYYYNSRRAAYRAAKRESGIPVSSTPVVNPNYNKHGVVMPGRAYEFGEQIIRDDYLGHVFDDGGYVPRHFNDIYGNHHFW